MITAILIALVVVAFAGNALLAARLAGKASESAAKAAIDYAGRRIIELEHRVAELIADAASSLRAELKPAVTAAATEKKEVKPKRRTWTETRIELEREKEESR